MIGFEDAFTLALYFGGMLGIVLLAYYSRTSQSQEEEIVRNTPLPPSPTITQTDDVSVEPENVSVELEETKEEDTEPEPEQEVPDELLTETSANNNPAVVYRGIITQLGSETDGTEDNPYPTGYDVPMGNDVTLNYEQTEGVMKKDQ